MSGLKMAHGGSEREELRMNVCRGRGTCEGVKERRRHSYIRDTPEGKEGRNKTATGPGAAL